MLDGSAILKCHYSRFRNGGNWNFNGVSNNVFSLEASKKSSGNIWRKLARMLRPSELINSIFVLCSLLLLTECSLINDPKSTIICQPGPVSYNMSLANGINAGVFTPIHTTTSMPQCIRESCNRRAGHVAFLIENSCFMVSCFEKKYCEPVANDGPNLLKVQLAHYTYFEAAPNYTKFPHTIYVKENNDIGQFIINLHAKTQSREAGLNAPVTFSIAEGNEESIFKLINYPRNNSASLILQRELDREVASGYNLTIKALNIHENKFRLAHIRIVVIDENDNAPTFPPSGYHTTIFTNVTEGQEIFRVNAIDVDTGDNANIRYHLLNHQQLFSIMPKTGVLVKTKERFAIDRTRNFTVIVVAINGEFKNVGTVTITVHPVNERRPTFLKRNYEVKVSEAVQVGTSVAKVFAADPDYGNLGKLRYSILTESCPFFGIDDDGVIRNVQPLTRHGGENCTLEITAQDSGIPPLETPRPATVSIVIEPVENLKFDVPVYEISIPENIILGSEILTVRAVAGSGNRRNPRKIVYSIENIDGALSFKIGKHTGRITTRTHIDYEKTKEYRLNLVARNRKEIDKALVIIRVDDLNDNKPRFVLPVYNKVISENTTVDATILRVTANDADSGENARLNYAIETGNTNDTFALDTSTGELRLHKSLRGKHYYFYNLTLTAKDQGEPAMTSDPVHVFIKVQRHDSGPTKRPTFPVPIYLATVNESTPLYTEILRVRARNERKYEGSISYFLSHISGGDKEGDVDLHFGVNSQTGAIRLNKKLDYEKTKRYVFLVGAIDVRTASPVDTVLVRILVQDVNDNRPEFYQYRYSRVFLKEPPLYYAVDTVMAKDADSGQNGRLSYWISGGNEGNFFAIDSRTGVVKTSRMLQRQTLRLFNLTISVADQGSPPMKSEKDALVQVLIFHPISLHMTLVETSETTMRLQFNLKYMDINNIKTFGVIVQEYVNHDSFEMYTKRPPLTWFLVHFIQKENQYMHRYVSLEVENSLEIMSKSMLEVIIGNEKNCDDKSRAKTICNGPLSAGAKYRFQLRVHLKSSGPFRDMSYKDSDFSDAFFTGISAAQETYKKESKRNYDAVVYTVGTALILVIVLAFLRGFYRLKLDRKRIHEEKKRKISYPVSNPRFQDPESPVEKIKTPGQGRKLVVVNAEKGSEMSRSDEDEGSSPDSALGHSERMELLRKQFLSAFRTKASTANGLI
ncbi:cadherin EGF LAG seven-pass G-type receptor 1 isoform X4 [Nematostella vectensis]|uniref:cadherin EGF LAG seven-pass G-type receptor 1 isoform X4 n=1 Tax=Nematostella vectensis TaxID=45351 RepID=UPI00207779DA|nr:cadherin EGF LAG seven-pass G-type receptor 1 isoform X4 [Nematostella vectensis]